MTRVTAMLAAQIKQQMFAAMKAKNTVEKEILKVVLGEIDTANSRRDDDISDEDIHKILRKLVKSNGETMKLSEDAAQKAVLQQENDVLNAYLPKTLDTAAIVAALISVADDIKAAGNDGQATGIAMKLLKSTGAAVGGKDVAQAVKQMRS